MAIIAQQTDGRIGAGERTLREGAGGQWRRAAADGRVAEAQGSPSPVPAATSHSSVLKVLKRDP
jgi:hypothetical protein